MKGKASFILVFFAFGIAASATNCWSQTLTADQTLNVNLQPAAELDLISGGTFILGGTAFGTFTATVSISSRIRTTPAGSGSITLQFNADFSGPAGPLIANGDLSFQCTAASYGTACSGTVSPTVSSSNTITTFGGGACTGGGTPCSASDPNQVTLQFSIPDKVSFKTGTYAADGTLTIAAL